jgi:hypothetical protein
LFPNLIKAPVSDTSRYIPSALPSGIQVNRHGAQIFRRGDLRFSVFRETWAACAGTGRELPSARSIWDFSIFGGFFPNMLFCSSAFQPVGCPKRAFSKAARASFKLMAYATKCSGQAGSPEKKWLGLFEQIPVTG